MVRRKRFVLRKRPQLLRTNGVMSIKATEKASVGVDGIEVPNDRSYTAKSITLHFVASSPMIVQVELFGRGSLVVWRSVPISVGVIPVRRTFRWPTVAAAAWPSTSHDTLFSVVAPCAGSVFDGAYVSVNYIVTAHLSADWDPQSCPKVRVEKYIVSSSEPTYEFLLSSSRMFNRTVFLLIILFMISLVGYYIILP